MSDDQKNDSLKKFIDKNLLTNPLKTPPSEWAHILQKIENNSPSQKPWLLSFFSLGGLVALAVGLLLFFNTTPHHLSPEQEAAIIAFLADTQELTDEDEDFDEYSYLSLIE